MTLLQKLGIEVMVCQPIEDCRLTLTVTQDEKEFDNLNEEELIFWVITGLRHFLEVP